MAGNRATDLVCLDYESEMATDLGELRVKWRIELAPGRDAGGGTEVSGETSRGVGVVKSLSVNSRGTVVGRYVSSLAVSSFVSFFTLPSPGTTREIS